MVATDLARPAAERSGWRSAAVPSEHGGWGLTAEPILLGLVVAWSVAGMALGLAAIAAFLMRTPLKLVAVDLRRGRRLDRTRLAMRIAAIELIVLAATALSAVELGGWRWCVPVLIAAPLVAVELSFEVRSRGRRLVPELCGTVGIAATVAAIALADHRSARLAAALWLVLAARSLGAIPFVRVQIVRMRRGAGPVRHSDLAQVASVAIAAVAVVVDRRLALGSIAVAVLAVAQSVWVRRAPIPARRLGLRQMALGLALVAVSAVGVLW
ncbi:MAG: YwiC-like family protein [Actinobacteria bacterium]|nr:YwiC-like family protein [Actinomycetota bacterium]